MGPLENIRGFIGIDDTNVYVSLNGDEDFIMYVVTMFYFIYLSCLYLHH